MVHIGYTMRTAFGAYGGSGKPCVGGLPVSWDADRDTAVARAHDQFRRAPGGSTRHRNLHGRCSMDKAELERELGH
ncbi:hypothetical protein ACFXGI_03165 [Streptomyces sp. NPDC059355]|uniref:hypothetical protein n=1 Tax=Streptomyces sp. NPDC059355 TaxID=3346811 RepID=UPI003686C3BF